MKRKKIRSIVLGLFVASFLAILDCDNAVLAQTYMIPQNEGNIAMYHINPLTGQRIPDEAEKVAMEKALQVFDSFVQAVQNKQYKVAYNLLSPDLQNHTNYDNFVNGYSNVVYLSLLSRSIFNYEGNLVVIKAESEEIRLLDNGKRLMRAFKEKFVINKINDEWKIVGVVSQEIW